MENPIAIVKNSLSVSRVIGFVAVGIVAFAVLDLLGWTNWLLFPVTTLRSRTGK